MPRDPLIGIVGKPSSGKSTTLNSLTDASAAVGAFPFTTIEPNKATGYLQVQCACSRFPNHINCKPNYGWCSDGNRHVPITLLDVAGLVPGAHEGRGLGNKFLDDLRHADALIHVVDVSGTTDAEGKATRGYDPLNDIEWLQEEIRLWIQGNLLKRWPSIVRKHTATNSTTLQTLQAQFGGYGATLTTTQRTLDSLPADLPPLPRWDESQVSTVVKAFMQQKFPTVLALNKIDHPDADKNISKIILKYPQTRAVLTSAITELFLRKLVKQRYIHYKQGSDIIETYEDLPTSSLRPLDDALNRRIENVRDLILYRFGSTGVLQVLQAAADLLHLIPVYPVRNLHPLNGGGAAAAATKQQPHPENIFRDCLLVEQGTTVRSVARTLVGDAPLASVETLGGTRVSDSAAIEPGKNDILSFRLAPRPSAAPP
ncbi:uncharacterized protein Ecym_2481 [Eremothecium cymbalariae DBVPG|uniref:OBG-type G domain-containing protein n=1 Tax=Eremothecium cymbalariae (strain CBS 270.75 / DBVPG 7215 / KCTC 17166 / NRRL Y-17582) TaxID=931890 RepID=G8JPU6_ERECY|nr:Hypothetical protein Ecym_2481 [Eremothecium cymbalariae DBVPG\